MNWLAHLYLSESAPAFRIGNLLPDLLPGGVLVRIPQEFQAGIAQHHRIDRFTDQHPIVRRSIQRIEPPFRRFGGILTDLFYDHFLSRDWTMYSEETLEEFLAAFYESFEGYRGQIPELANERLEQIRREKWLSSYHDLAGLRFAVVRLSRRFRRPVDLAPAMAFLENHYAEFEEDFRAFFPELRAHVAQLSS